MTIDVSPRAFDDMEAIKAHITDQLQNPIAAENIISDILAAIRSLNELPERGAPLNTLINIKSSYRFIQSHSYAIFYRIEDERVFISRVIYKRKDFMRVFFSTPAEPDNDETTDFR